jgi:hypothetical protein
MPASWLLEEACQTNSARDLQCALIVGFAFGFAAGQRGVLCRLIGEDWHSSHEDVVGALRTWPTPDTVETLFCATQWIPKSLEYDDARALAVKAIWALGRIPGAEAESKLDMLSRSDNSILRKSAEEQLKRRRGGA